MKTQAQILNGQIYNGGFAQWHYNGFSSDGHKLIDWLLSKKGTIGRQVASVLIEVMAEIDYANNDNDEELYNYLSSQDEYFYQITANNAFVNEIS